MEDRREEEKRTREGDEEWDGSISHDIYTSTHERNSDLESDIQVRDEQLNFLEKVHRVCLIRLRIRIRALIVECRERLR